MCVHDSAISSCSWRASRSAPTTSHSVPVTSRRTRSCGWMTWKLSSPCRVSSIVIESTRNGMSSVTMSTAPRAPPAPSTCPRRSPAPGRGPAGGWRPAGRARRPPRPAGPGRPRRVPRRASAGSRRPGSGACRRRPRRPARLSPPPGWRPRPAGWRPRRAAWPCPVFPASRSPIRSPPATGDPAAPRAAGSSAAAPSFAGTVPRSSPRYPISSRSAVPPSARAGPARARPARRG